MTIRQMKDPAPGLFTALAMAACLGIFLAMKLGIPEAGGVLLVSPNPKNRELFRLIERREASLFQALAALERHYAHLEDLLIHHRNNSREGAQILQGVGRQDGGLGNDALQAQKQVWLTEAYRLKHRLAELSLRDLRTLQGPPPPFHSLAHAATQRKTRTEAQAAPRGEPKAGGHWKTAEAWLLPEPVAQLALFQYEHLLYLRHREEARQIALSFFRHYPLLEQNGLQARMALPATESVLHQHWRRTHARFLEQVREACICQGMGPVFFALSLPGRYAQSPCAI